MEGLGFQWTPLLQKDIFQKKLKAAFLNEPGVTETEADMVVFGKTNWKQDGNLLNSLEPGGTTPTSSHPHSVKQIHGRNDLKWYYNQILLW